MPKEIKITKELIQKVKEAKSAEELKAIAKGNEVELNDEQAAGLFSKLNTSGELADDELDAVVGGGCGGKVDAYCPQCGEQGERYLAYLNYAKCSSCNIVWQYK